MKNDVYRLFYFFAPGLLYTILHKPLNIRNIKPETALKQTRKAK